MLFLWKLKAETITHNPIPELWFYRSQKASYFSPQKTKSCIKIQILRVRAPQVSWHGCSQPKPTEMLNSTRAALYSDNFQTSQVKKRYQDKNFNQSSANICQTIVKTRLRNLNKSYFSVLLLFVFHSSVCKFLTMLPE